jgi:hypothetical protein
MSRFFPAAVAILALALAPAAATSSLASASGSGHIVFATTHEFVSFSAMQTAGTAATGNANVHDVTASVRVRVDVNCLNVIGNTAIVSGVVTSSSDPTAVPVGDEAIFEVVDGGEGASSVDLMSLVNFFAVGTGNDCSVPGEFDLVPVQQGNVQVRS